MNLKKFLLLASSLLFAPFQLLIAGAAHAEAPNVVVSIKPIHSLVASIMQGVGKPSLIVEGAASPHTYSMKPSNASALEQANIVFWVGHGLEAFLEKPLETLGSDAKIVELDDAPGLEKLKFREGGAFEAHDDGDEHAHGAEDAHSGEEAHHHDEGEYDMHLWLDPANARAMAAEIEKTLAEADSGNAATYKANLEALNGRLDKLDKTIEETVTPIKDKPFIVFHDAYQYFEHRYHVKVAGSITVSPETMPGAQRLSEIHAKIEELGATCVFAEPQFEPKLVNVVLEGTQAKSGTLDPEAGTLDAGPELYFQMMESIGASLKSCLSSGS
ncbi:MULTISPECIES: zinc ABC transporter substrate-binding protein ZnuA [unclassified Rhizobium]|uniref:zinc ABC transporter substrate-binding protein ZnuA n=1 Tax=unclassified Rhizobium TaxID=2613769 RepID=UPI0007134EA7|nr:MULTISPECIES: zinc ABC transporter substrate-binding protein ZnuA [unclassified Rhizobium]KQS98067.1 zinc transporter [Rhizobium sp. Leaf386]KQT00328.1 zinc transporter [Rhizobium sp. Leaf391]KQT97331.1 zinc transporter [Rhizobium sp. Leaf453]